MMAAQASAGPRLEWAFASAALEEGISGDLHVVLPTETHTLISVIDGLGHGPSAQLAARECAAILRSHAGAPVLDLLRYCHEGLRDTRGVVMTVALVDEATGTLDWAGVGNVEGVVWRRAGGRAKVCASVVTRGGVVGFRLPPLKANQATLKPGDIIVFVTDGIQSDYVSGIDAGWSAEELAQQLLQGFNKNSDDALVLVARYLSGAPA